MRLLIALAIASALSGCGRRKSERPPVILGLSLVAVLNTTPRSQDVGPATFLPEGGIAAYEPSSRTVHLYDSSGRSQGVVKPAGRERFHHVAWIGPGGSDSAVIFDFGASRFVAVDLSDGGTRGITLPAMPDLVWPAVVGVLPAERLLLLGNAMPSPGAGTSVTEDSSRLFSLSLRTEEMSPFSKPEFVRPTHHMEGFSTTLPWEPVGTFAVLGDLMLRSSGADSAVELVDSNDVERAKIFVPLAARRVRSEDVKEALSSAETQGLLGSALAMRRIIAATVLPARSPYITFLLPATESTFWARGWGAGSQSGAHCVLTTTDGRTVDSLVLPADLELVAASGRRLLIRWTAAESWLGLYELTAPR